MDSIDSLFGLKKNPLPVAWCTTPPFTRSDRSLRRNNNGAAGESSAVSPVADADSLYVRKQPGPIVSSKNSVSNRLNFCAPSIIVMCP